MRLKLSSNDFVQIAGEAVVSPQTVRRVYRDGRCAGNTLVRIHRAAKKLGYPPPPKAGSEASLHDAEPEIEPEVA